MVRGYPPLVPGELTMRHMTCISSQRPVHAATLLTKSQAISNAMGIIQVGQETLVLVQQFLNIFAKGE